MIDFQSPQGIFEKIKMLPKLAELGSFFPKTVRSAPCKEVIRTRQFFALAISDPQVLAAGCRTFHYLAVGDHAKSRNNKAQRGRLSHAGV